MSGEAFGAMLRRLRCERGLSQNQLSRQSGIDPAYVNRFERAGETNTAGNKIKHQMPSRDVALSLAEVLDLTYAERDRLLFVAGLAPEIDWQARCEDIEAALQTVRDAVGVLTTAVEPTLIRSRAG